MTRWNSTALVALFLGCLAGCSGSAGAGGALAGALPGTATTDSSSSGYGVIKHVIVVIQENRSFDNFFATYPGADGALSGETSDGSTVPLAPIALKSRLVLDNSFLAFQVDYDGGKMDQFNLVTVNPHERRCTCVYAYVRRGDIEPYWTMARQYVLGDHMFTTEASGSFTGHQDLIRGSAELSSGISLIDFPTSEPWGCDAPTGTVTTLLTSTTLLPGSWKYQANKGPFPCLSYATLRDLLDAKGVTWKYYTPAVHDPDNGGQVWDAFDAISAVRNGPEWNTNVSSPNTNFFSDVSANALPAVSWVVPDGQNSDHPAQQFWHVSSDTGPSWVASIVNAIGRSPYWNSTAIVVVWDDWGGWYDHVPPPQLDYKGLGFRVPLLVISPYAKAGYVSHTQYESGSILRFIEDTFGLGRLGTSDTRANSIADAFDFGASPRKFKTIPAKYSKSFFLHQKPSNIPVDTQ
ncbi:MAG TPA: alkaline phosphatase family protein [Candidatus Acidoferrales bacterium]|nr:alkaline phosphatase family protein [Candidatus Acidoferrales bacterium]